LVDLSIAYQGIRGSDGVYRPSGINDSPFYLPLHHPDTKKIYRLEFLK